MQEETLAPTVDQGRWAFDIPRKEGRLRRWLRRKLNSSNSSSSTLALELAVFLIPHFNLNCSKLHSNNLVRIKHIHFRLA